MSNPALVKALYFDVFGTVADWYSQVVLEGNALSRKTGLSIDWGDFALRWRIDGYIAALLKIANKQMDLVPTEQIHRTKLDQLLLQANLTTLPEPEIAHFNRVWNRIQPWPDVVAGLSMLRQHYMVIPFSNGDMRCLVEISKNSDLVWDAIISADIFKKVKPDPSIYSDAAKLMNLAPSEIMMVACHAQDLAAAKQSGMRAAYVARPLEYGPERKPDEGSDTFDYNVSDFIALAEALRRDRHA